MIPGAIVCHLFKLWWFFSFFRSTGLCVAHVALSWVNICSPYFQITGQVNMALRIANISPESGPNFKVWEINGSRLLFPAAFTQSLSPLLLSLPMCWFICFYPLQGSWEAIFLFYRRRSWAPQRLTALANATQSVRSREVMGPSASFPAHCSSYVLINFLPTVNP